MNYKGTGSIFCLIAAILMGARYIAAAVFMSSAATKEAALFADGLSYTGPVLLICAIAALAVGICFILYGFVKDGKK